MRHGIVATLTIALLVGPSSTGSYAANGKDASHGWHVRCGDDSKPVGYGWFDSKGFNVTCKTVRRVANHYVFESLGDRHFNGWSCDDDRIGTEVSRVDCKRRSGGHQHVRFKWGA